MSVANVSQSQCRIIPVIASLCDRAPQFSSFTRYAAPIWLAAFVLWGCVLSFHTARLNRETDDTTDHALATLELRH